MLANQSQESQTLRNGSGSVTTSKVATRRAGVVADPAEWKWKCDKTTNKEKKLTNVADPAEWKWKCDLAKFVA